MTDIGMLITITDDVRDTIDNAVLDGQITADDAITVLLGSLSLQLSKLSHDRQRAKVQIITENLAASIEAIQPEPRSDDHRDSKRKTSTH